MEAGEGDGALVAGVCNYFLVSGGWRWRWSRGRELTDKGLGGRREFCVADEDGVCRKPLVRNRSARRLLGGRSLLLATTNCVCDELRTPRATMAPEAKVGELAAAARAGRARARVSFMVE